jgi:hypothetical protein
MYGRRQWAATACAQRANGHLLRVPAWRPCLQGNGASNQVDSEAEVLEDVQRPLSPRVRHAWGSGSEVAAEPNNAEPKQQQRRTARRQAGAGAASAQADAQLHGGAGPSGQLVGLPPKGRYKAGSATAEDSDCIMEAVVKVGPRGGQQCTNCYCQPQDAGAHACVTGAHLCTHMRTEAHAVHIDPP